MTAYPEPRRERLPWLQVAVLVALIGVITAALVNMAQPVIAGYSPAGTFNGYSYKYSGCSTITDPITIVFTNGSGLA